jgi:hypothetical protein
MEHRKSSKARLLVAIPVERIDYVADDDSKPEVGDIVVLDHGFAGPDGVPMGMVACYNPDGTTRWAGDVMDSEMEMLQ